MVFFIEEKWNWKINKIQTKCMSEMCFSAQNVQQTAQQSYSCWCEWDIVCTMYIYLYSFI